MIFDRYIVVDWSASNRPRTGRDSIWVCGLTADGRGSTANPCTRGSAEFMIRDLLRHYVDSGERVLIGCDFPYGYPVGFAAELGLTGKPWRAIWDYLTVRLCDDAATNISNRFQVAAGINARLEYHVFWGRPATQPSDHLSARRDQVAYAHGAAEAGLGEWRQVEKILRARKLRPHSAWQLLGSGSVGSQALTGIPVLSRLRHDADLAPVSLVWPFEVEIPQLARGRAAVIHAEVWPSLSGGTAVSGQVKDQTQVMSTARELRELDRAGDLAGLFKPPHAAREEGWILGVRE